MTDDQNQDDSALFRAAVGDVRPLRHDQAPTRTPPPRPVPRQREADEKRVLDELLDGPIDPGDLETGEELTFLREGVQKRVLRRLRRGQFSVQAELDLHGMTVPVARAQLRQFINDSRRRDVRCVRIIHGKGLRSHNRGPVLKGLVDRWLRQLGEVIAFASARPVDGGTGAVYVLLRAPSR